MCSIFCQLYFKSWLELSFLIDELDIGLHSMNHALGLLNSICSPQGGELQEAPKAGLARRPQEAPEICSNLGRSSTEIPKFCCTEHGRDGFALGRFDGRCYLVAAKCWMIEIPHCKNAGESTFS